jgi:ABC-2 type transport system permease protein
MSFASRASMYAAFAATAFQTGLAYRAQVRAWLFGHLVGVLARIAVWSAVYIGVDSIDGITRAEMITYAVLAGSVVAAWDYADMINDLGAAVKTGDIAVHLLKPLHYPLYLLSTQTGNLLFGLVTVVLPVIVFVALTYGMLPPASLFHGLAFPVFWLVSFLTAFLLATLCGLLSFWLMTSQALEWFLSGILALFSGNLLPIWFMPEGFAALVRVLPFAWIGYYPTAVYLGKLDVNQTLFALGGGLAWVLVLALGVALLWSRTGRRLIVQGG